MLRVKMYAFLYYKRRFTLIVCSSIFFIEDCRLVSIIKGLGMLCSCSLWHTLHSLPLFLTRIVLVQLGYIPWPSFKISSCITVPGAELEILSCTGFYKACLMQAEHGCKKKKKKNDQYHKNEQISRQEVSNRQRKITKQKSLLLQVSTGEVPRLLLLCICSTYSCTQTPSLLSLLNRCLTQWIHLEESFVNHFICLLLCDY